MVESLVEAIPLFFVAVLFVIVGTYTLFTSGSIALLKLLKRNKKFYYQSRNFISVSGMIYRMKQNAVGLASICILCTMVLVTISTTVSLYIGQESMMRDLYPLDVGIVGAASEVDPLAIQSLIAIEKTKANVEVTDGLAFNFNQISAIREGNLFLSDNFNENNSDAINYEKMIDLWMITTASLKVIKPLLKMLSPMLCKWPHYLISVAQKRLKCFSRKILRAHCHRQTQI